MPVSEVLKKFREKGYEDAPEKEEPETTRVIKLTDEEAKELQGYQKEPGMEQECLVTGKLEEDGHFHVMSVHAPGGGPGQNEMDEMAGQVAGSPMGGPPMMAMQTQPSPS